jgi:hypothetical protein
VSDEPTRARHVPSCYVIEEEHGPLLRDYLERAVPTQTDCLRCRHQQRNVVAPGRRQGQRELSKTIALSYLSVLRRGRYAASARPAWTRLS